MDVTVITTSDGRNVAISNDADLNSTIHESDMLNQKVPVFEDENGSYFTKGGQCHVEDKVLVSESANGKLVVTRLRPYDRCIKAVDAFNRAWDLTNAYFGVPFKWDGRGKVYVLPSCTPSLVNRSYAQDKLTVTGSRTENSVSYQYATSADTIPAGPPLEVTGVLVKGLNTVTLKISSVYQTNIGCIDLYIVQII